MNLVFATASPGRIELLQQSGIACSFVPADIDERALPVLGGEHHAVTLATAKAMWVSERRPQELVIGADQIASLGDQILHKPITAAVQAEQLRALRGRWHELSTGLSLVRGLERLDSALVTTRLRVRADLTEREIASYLQSGEGRQCCGGYQIEGRGIQLFDAIDGDWSNIVGLPLLQLLQLLRRQGWTSLQDPS